MHLFRTDLSKLRTPIVIGEEPLLVDKELYRLPDGILDEVEKVVGLFDGLPFFLDETGNYDRDVSGFFLFAAADGARSTGTLQVYAEQINLWFRYLAAQGKDWRRASRDDVRAYYRVRRLNGGVSASTWNLGITAIARFYEWAAWEKLIPETPVPYKWKQILSGGEVRVARQAVAMLDRNVEKRVRFVTTEQFRVLVEGLRNLGGRRSRTSSRNIVLTKLLVQTGMRISEALQMRCGELPDPDHTQFAGLKSVSLRLRRETTKGNKSRAIRVPKQILREVHRYCEDERSINVERRGDRDPSYVEPEEIWLNEEGDPLSRNAVEKLFARASALTGVDCTPHFLRHTFAIYTLSRLIQLMFNKVPQEKDNLDKQTYLRICEDPARKVQQLLGHAQLSTTYKYLDYINLHDRLTDLAVGEWSEDLGATEELLDQGEPT
jgi:site-specific recombinase XerD